MKRFVKHKTENIPTLIFDIEVDVVIDELSDDIAASGKLVDHPVSINKKNKFEDIYVDILDEVSYSVLNTVVNNRFEIINYRQSKESCTFYPEFNPTYNNDNVYTSFSIIFRISDHKLNFNELNAAKSGRVVVKSFNLDKKKFQDYEDIFYTLEDICKSLKQENVEVLNKYVVEL